MKDRVTTRAGGLGPPVLPGGQASPSRPSVIQLVFREKGALYAAYIPVFTDGGLQKRIEAVSVRVENVNSSHIDLLFSWCACPRMRPAEPDRLFPTGRIRRTRVAFILQLRKPHALKQISGVARQHSLAPPTDAA